jgi:Na+-transporting methylmalonyl-CoA/oxaloacetate decarboxylase gamma subunit
MLWDAPNLGLSIGLSFAPLTTDNGLPLAVMGIFVVFLALALVVAFITVLPRVLALLPGEALEEAVIATPRDPDELSEETVIVVAAAVAAVVSQPHRIVRIRGLTPGESGWSLEGRMQQHQSHRIKPRAKR